MGESQKAPPQGIDMVVLKLLGYALGTVVMYLGIGVLVVAPLLLVVVLVLLLNALSNQITGRDEEWNWFVQGVESAIEHIHRLKAEWIGWIPGMVIQVWYAGYAASLVQTSTPGATLASTLVIHATGVIGVILAAAVFYGLYAQIIQVHLGRWIYWLLGGAALGAYGVFLQQPQTAAWLSESWQRGFTVLLSVVLEALSESL